MKKFAYMLVASAAFAALATPASAQVGGGRIEALVGWDHASVDFNDFGLNDDLNSDGIVFGIGAGYDFALSPTASMGVDVELTESTADLDLTDGTDSVDINVGRDIYVGGRVTFAASPTTNIYVKAGYTNARINIETAGTTVFDDSANADGIRGGLGAQFTVGRSAYVGAEYRYSNYEADFSRHQLVATLGFRM